MAAIDSRSLGALQKTIVTAGNPIVFPATPAGLVATGTKMCTAIVRPLTNDVALSNVQLKTDPAAGTYAFLLSTGCEVIGVTQGTVDAGTVEVFFTFGA